MGKHKHGRVVKIEQLRHTGRPCLAVCTGKHCTKAGAGEILRAVEAALNEADLSSTVALERTTCQDYCDNAPTMTVMPGGYAYVELNPDAARQIVHDHVCDGRPVLAQLHKRIRRKLERRLARELTPPPDSDR